jgi:hypothetical protein
VLKIPYSPDELGALALIELALKANRLGCVKGTTGYRLHESPFLKLPALVNPAAVLGADLLAIPEAGIGLQHHGRTRFEHDPLGFIFGLLET